VQRDRVVIGPEDPDPRLFTFPALVRRRAGRASCRALGGSQFLSSPRIGRGAWPSTVEHGLSRCFHNSRGLPPRTITMPPKSGPSKKAVDKSSAKIVEDLTFGLKNKSKSKKVRALPPPPRHRRTAMRRPAVVGMRPFAVAPAGASVRGQREEAGDGQHGQEV